MNKGRGSENFLKEDDRWDKYQSWRQTNATVVTCFGAF